jgi:hypothetical protein
MRSARFFLACAVLSVLAACGIDPVAPTVETTGSEVTPSSQGPKTNTAAIECAGSIQAVTLSDGSVTYQCVLRQSGSGG